MNIDHIVTFEENYYRIGDIIRSNAPDVINNVYLKPEYKNSFITLFLDEMKKHTNEHQTLENFRLNMAAKTIYIFPKKDIHHPPDNTLIIHLRLGDVFNITKTTFQADFYKEKILPRKPNMQHLLDEINKSTFKNIIIVTAYHHNIGGTFKSQPNTKILLSPSNIKSKVFLRDLLSKIPSRFNVSIRSSPNPDDDFILLCRAKNLLVSSKSSFSDYAKRINSIINTGNYLPYDIKTSRIYKEPPQKNLIFR